MSVMPLEMVKKEGINTIYLKAKKLEIFLHNVIMLKIYGIIVISHGYIMKLLNNIHF